MNTECASSHFTELPMKHVYTIAATPTQKQPWSLDKIGNSNPHASRKCCTNENTDKCNVEAQQPIGGSAQRFIRKSHRKKIARDDDITVPAIARSSRQVPGQLCSKVAYALAFFTDLTTRRRPRTVDGRSQSCRCWRRFGDALCAMCVCRTIQRHAGPKGGLVFNLTKKLLATPLISHSSRAATIPVSAPVFLRSKRARAFGLDKGG
ncbi:hypothetical protein VTI28DRAFT_6871 [Corynascus sepedonium]